MRKLRFTALLLGAVLGMNVLAACSNHTKSSDTSSEGAEPKADWSVITPDEDSMEADLGNYRIDPDSGIKLYYDEEVYPRELMIALENHFTSLQNRDFESYKLGNLPEYNDIMEAFLQKDYQYGLDQSFEGQCLQLEENIGGSYKITRIKVEPSVNCENAEEGITGFFANLDETFECRDFTEKIKPSCDELYYFTFYIMAQPESGGEEAVLLSEYDIPYVKKDGKYYTFG